MHILVRGGNMQGSCGPLDQLISRCPVTAQHFSLSDECTAWEGKRLQKDSTIPNEMKSRKLMETQTHPTAYFIRTETQKSPTYTDTYFNLICEVSSPAGIGLQDPNDFTVLGGLKV